MRSIPHALCARLFLVLNSAFGNPHSAFEYANFFMDDTGISDKVKDKDLTPYYYSAQGRRACEPSSAAAWLCGLMY
jgi:hypothetical protein